MSRRLPNLNQLRVFEAAARHLSFRAAAEELFVTQAAVSHQIKGLEEFYGCRLFDRLNREVRLPPAAKELAASLSVALDEIADASHKFQASQLSGRLRISTSPFYANRMILPFIDDFRQLYPNLEIEFDYRYSFADFASDDIDAALRYGQGDWADVDARLMHLDLVSPVTSPALVRKFKLPMTATDITKLPLAAVMGQERYWLEWFSAAGVEDLGTLNFSFHEHRGLALDFALAGNAVALADLPLIRNELETGSLVRLSGVLHRLDRGVHLATLSGPFPDPRVTVFADWLSGLVEPLIAVAQS